jgi:hypothetical protein
VDGVHEERAALAVRGGVHLPDEPVVVVYHEVKELASWLQLTAKGPVDPQSRR